MSHYNGFNTQITDLEALVRALCKEKIRGHVITRDMIEVHDKPAKLNGYYGTDNRTAQVIIRKQNYQGYGDMGFVKNSDGTYMAIVDDSDVNDQYRGSLQMHYNIEKTKMTFESKGIKYVEAKDEKGRIQLRAKFQDVSGSRIQVKAR